MKTRLPILSLTLLGVVSMVRADAIDDLVNERIKSRGTPGIALAIVKNGKVERLKGYGIADIENKVSVTSDTVFQIGSVTKQFTATLIMSLVQEGKVALDAPISTYLPDLPESWRDATILQALHHRTGIPSYTDIPGFGGKARLPGSDKALIEFASATPLQYKHGEKWSYNNTAYYLLGMVVEKVLGKSFDEVLQERICKPLGMSATRMQSWSAIIPHRAKGYDPSPNGPTNAGYLDEVWPGAAGAIISSASDLAKWAIAQETFKLLNAASWKQMFETRTPVNAEEDYALGWSVKVVNKIRLIEHGGAIPGFKSQILRVPSKGISVVVLANSIGEQTESLSQRIAEQLVPELKVVVEGITDPTPDLTKRIRSVIEQGIRGELKPEDFEEPLKSAIFPENQFALRDMLGAKAKITSMVLVKVNDQPGVKDREYVLEIGSAKLKVAASVAANGKFVGLMFRNQ